MFKGSTLVLICCSLMFFHPSAALPAQTPVPALRITLTTEATQETSGSVLSPAGKTRPRIGIALAGGGAKAAASIGVLNVLVKEGIPVDAIAGTSMGAGIGGLYAAGYSPDEIEDIFLTNDWNDIFKDTPPRAFLTQQQKEAGSRHLLEFTFIGGSIVPPSGLTAGQKLTNLLAGKTLAASFEANMDFDLLRTPFRAVATDIETGEPVIIGKGLLHDAMRASAAIPVVFQPVEIEGRLLVDGGMSNNLPVEVVRSMGMDVVIAVDPSSKLESKDKLDSVVNIFNQAISLQVRRETERQRRLADLLIVPNTDDYAFTDFPSMAEIIRKGEEAAREALPRIRELMAPKQPSPLEPRYRITDLAIRGAVTVDEATVRQTMAPVLLPRESTEQDLRAAMAAAFAAGPFEELSLELTARGDAYYAVLTVRENPVVAAINISGNTLVSTDEIRKLLAWQLGQPLNGARLSTTFDKLVKRLRSQGYLLFRIDRAGMLDDGHTLSIVISEGMVNSISYRDKTRTQRSLIQRETITRPGAPLNFFTAADDLQHLYALDYFESIDADLERSPLGGVDIKLRIKEKPTNRIRLGLRYDLEDSFTALTDIVVDNITGRGIKAFLYTRYGNYTDVTLGYTSPVFIRSNFLHTVQAFYRQRDYLLYQGFAPYSGPGHQPDGDRLCIRLPVVQVRGYLSAVPLRVGPDQQCDPSLPLRESNADRKPCIPFHDRYAGPQHLPAFRLPVQRRPMRRHHHPMAETSNSGRPFSPVRCSCRWANATPCPSMYRPGSAAGTCLTRNGSGSAGLTACSAFPCRVITGENSSAPMNWGHRWPTAG